MSSEYNLDLYIPHKRKDLKLLLLLLLLLLLFSRMKNEELNFVFEHDGSLTNKREKFVKRHNHNITCQWKSLS